MYTSDNLKIRISNSLQIIQKFNWLLNSRVLDFFVDDHWNKLPDSWREYLNKIDPSEIGDVLLGNKPKNVLPLSLMALFVNVNNLALSRIQEEACEYFNNVIPQLDDFGCKNDSYKNLFLKRVKKKKRYELSVMSDLVFKTANNANCSAVVDIGSGLGHMVRTLAYKYKLKTVGIEAQQDLVNGASKLDDQFDVTISKYTKDKNTKETIKTLRPHHINVKLSPESKPSVLLQCNEIFDNEDFGLIGLHPCGDLAPLLLRMFKESNKIKYISIVGCCYMKLTCENCDFPGYPLSEYIKNMKYNTLSYESRELACHALEMYCERLKNGTYQDLQVHCYRALLEKLLVSKWPHRNHETVKSIKHYNTLTFENYCKIATERLNVSFDSEDVNSEAVTNELKRWKEVVMFYTLRLSLAPLVESVILMDRMLYLIENDILCKIIPVFDPLQSPRNHVLIAQKC